MRAVPFVLLVAGCTHNRPLNQVREVAGSQVEVSGMYGQAVTVQAVSQGNDVAFIDKSNGGYVPAGEIVKVTDVRRGQGAIEGLGIGALVGAGIGVVAGFASGDDKCDEESWCILTFTAEEKAAFGGILLGMTGGLVGLIVGATMGSTYIYSNESTGVAVIPIGPKDSVAGVTVKF